MQLGLGHVFFGLGQVELGHGQVHHGLGTLGEPPPPKKKKKKKKQKKNVFFGRVLPNVFTHPRVFVRFGNTKGEFSFVQNL